jgi:hypothetical protein
MHLLALANFYIPVLQHQCFNDFGVFLHLLARKRITLGTYLILVCKIRNQSVSTGCRAGEFI